MPSHRLLLWAGALGVAVAAGCYRAMPLDSEALGKALAPPNMEAIRVQAKTLQHPLLRPIEFDERDGLSPDEAAILAVLNRLFEARSEIATLLAEIESTADKLASAEGAVPILEELVRTYEDALAAGVNKQRWGPSPLAATAYVLTTSTEHGARRTRLWHVLPMTRS